MKIVQLLPSLDLGGMERLAVDLARQQKAEGHEPSIYCTSHPGLLASEANAANVPVHSFGKTTGFSIRLIRDLASRLRVDRPDVLHAHNALVLHYGISAACLARVPVVINTRHGGNMNWDPHCERIWRRAVRWIDSLVFVSEGVRDYYVTKDRLSRRNTTVIYNGIDVDKFAAIPAHPTAAHPRFRVGCVGRLVPAKDHLTLIRSFALVIAAIPEAELHILGDGPCREAISQAAESLRISNRVFLHGASLDVPGFLSTLDLFVLSSLDEGLPISLMEAMAAGLPVVSTRLPGLTELAPESVVAGYCSPGQPESLAEQILRAANRHDLPAIGRTASRWAQKFSIRETWHAYQSVIEASLAKGNRYSLNHLAQNADNFASTDRGQGRF
ncbi:MAG TPA: glycosyltransferase [Candidatus Acidoferrum sp.]|nr:glycosyltransferase [Candidatus Acidoferrum sp.]